MAQPSEETIRRVTEKVFQEMTSAQEAFSVADLRAAASELGGVGDDVAWKISYDTKREAGFAPGTDVSAWKISYDTKREAGFSPEVVERIIDRGESS
jgi:hypothetical protein